MYVDLNILVLCLYILDRENCNFLETQLSVGLDLYWFLLIDPEFLMPWRQGFINIR